LVHPVTKVLLISWDIPVNGKLVEGKVLVVFRYCRWKKRCRNPEGVDTGNIVYSLDIQVHLLKRYDWTQKISQSNTKPQEV